MAVTDEDVIEAMKDVIDPELGINVVDLGLVYGVSVDENNSATVDMTLTSAAGLGEAAARLTKKYPGKAP